jgi:hypothetical protein
MGKPDPNGRLRYFEESIRSLSGVRGARAIGGPSGLDSARVLIVPERDALDTVRAVQALALSCLDQPIERSQVHVITESVVSRQAPRRRLFSLVTERSPDRFTVRIALELGGDVLIGEAHSPLVRDFERMTVVRATLDGLGALLTDPVEPRFVDILSVGDAGVAVSVLSRAGQTLVGSALIHHDENDAIARATLDAVNRFMREKTTTGA